MYKVQSCAGVVTRPARRIIKPQINQTEYEVTFTLSYQVEADDVMGAVEAALDDFEFSDLKHSDIVVRPKGCSDGRS